MTERSDVSIPCGTLMLEGILEIPSPATASIHPAVICHPHPLFGGNMHNNVVRAARNALVDKGFACLRFNFRGTGASWGTHGNGVDEVEDVLAAVDFVEATPRIDRNGLVLAGYSFGCWVGLKAVASDPRPQGLIGISPPVDSYDFDFLKQERRPKLLIAGDRDFVCSKRAFLELLDQIPEPKHGVIIPGADHFHIGHEETIIEEIKSFLQKFQFDVA